MFNNIISYSILGLIGAGATMFIFMVSCAVLGSSYDCGDFLKFGAFGFILGMIINCSDPL